MAWTRMLLDAIPRPAILVPLIAILGLLVYEALRPKAPFEVKPRLPKLPIVGAKDGECFPMFRAKWRNFLDVRKACLEAYKYDTACILPIVDLGGVVVVPEHEITWYLNEADHSVNTLSHLKDAFQLNWTLWDPKIIETDRPIHHVLISSRLTREIDNILPVSAADIPQSVDNLWGTQSGSETETCLMDELPAVLGSVLNVALVGKPTCHNRSMIQHAIEFAQGLAITAILLRITPQWLRPVLGPLVTIPQKLASRRYFRELGPEVERRLARSRSGAEAVNNDFLQWTVDEAVKSGDPYMMQPETIMGRLTMLNFLTIHTSTLAISNVLLDLASSPRSVIDELREEIIAALKTHRGAWNKQTLADMPKLDSVFRESQRMNPPATIGSPKLVMAPEGVTMPSGLHLQYGTYLAVAGYAVLRDPEIYPEPETFKPFRFAEARQAAEEKSLQLEKARQSWTATSKTYTTFGSGRHACPGRFFASASVKVFLSYILLNCDIERKPSRGVAPTIGMAIVPPLKDRIRVKRLPKPLYDWESDVVPKETFDTE